MRDEKARKALGALSQVLIYVPELPYIRAAEMLEAIVGGAYLFGSELWALYIDRRKTMAIENARVGCLGLAEYVMTA